MIAKLILLNKNKRGFTLIELLVVVSIIGLLSSIVLASLNSARTKAKEAKAKMEMKQFIDMAVVAQGESGKALRWITLSEWSAVQCEPSHRLGNYGLSADLRNIPTSDPCYTVWQWDLSSIQAATNGVYAGSGLDQMLRDPWGSPYALDENEDEPIGAELCRIDNIESVGPDGVFGTSDDIKYDIPPRSICP